MLVPTSQFVRTLVAARLAADVLDVPTLVVARTDALSAALLTSDVDDVDRELLTGERTPEGFYRVRDGIEAAIARGLAYAPYADLVWCETSTPDLAEAEQFAAAIHERYPGKLLAYNCSPSFNWRKHLSDGQIAGFQRELARLGYRFQFITLAGLPRAQPLDVRAGARLPRRGHERLRALQEREFALEDARLHGEPPPARGRRRLLRPGDAGRDRRDLVDPRARADRPRSSSSTRKGAPHEQRRDPREARPPDRASERPAVRARDPSILTRAELASCTCPEHCERDHGDECSRAVGESPA